MTDEPRTTYTSDDDGWPEDLAMQHRRYLGSRGVSPQVAAARGYRTLTAKSGPNSPAGLGWGKTSGLLDTINQRTGDAVMLIPLFHADTDTPSTYQARPDKPRMSPAQPGRKQRVLKFEMPYGVKRGTAPGDLPADVNPLRHHEAVSSDWPLILTEGIPKADALLTAALREDVEVVPVALTGVTMGYESDHTGVDQQAVERTLADMVTTLASGRKRVYLCWDSDWAEKRQVRDSLVRTGQLLAKAGVEEVVYLSLPAPDGDDPDAKTGVDDWLAAGGSIADLLENHQMEAPEIDPTAQGAIEAVPEVLEVNSDDLFMWDYMLKRIGDSSKPVPVPTVKLGGVAEIIEIVSTKRIVGMQLGIVAVLLLATPVDFVENLSYFTTLILILNSFGAVQDVAIDALATQTLKEDERGIANGFMFAGASIGQAIGGSAVLYLAATMPFQNTYFLASLHGLPSGSADARL